MGVTLGFCAAALGLGSNTKLLEALKQGSLYLDSLVNDFVIQSKELGIDLVCFYELYKTKVSLKRLLPFNFTMMVGQPVFHYICI